MGNHRRYCFLLLYCLILGAGFWRVGATLVTFSLNDNLNSYGLIIPAISVFLLIRRRQSWVTGSCQISTVSIFVLLGIIGLLGALVPDTGGWHLDMNQGLPALVFAFISFFIAGFTGFLGAAAFSMSKFPLLFLYLMVPLPEWIEAPLTTLLQYGSATVAYLFLKLTIFPMYWEDVTVFNLPGITLQVAEECSGIRSTVILLITTILTSHLMLKTRRARLLLILLALPIGILRNAFRIWILALLAVYVDPAALASPLHHSGGPLFFVLALILLFVVTYLLRRAESRLSQGKDHP